MENAVGYEETEGEKQEVGSESTNKRNAIGMKNRRGMADVCCRPKVTEGCRRLQKSDVFCSGGPSITQQGTRTGS